MDIVTYVLCKKLASSAVSGIKDISINGTDLIIETNDGETLTMEFPKPADGSNGISIVNVEINESNHLICTMSDGSKIDAGILPTTPSSGEVDPSNLNYATEEDIDKMFQNLEPLNPDVVDYATEEDIDKLFK